MRSFSKLAALSAFAALPAFLALPNIAYADSYWDHNGSRMKIEEDGKTRKIVYEQPRSTLADAGVKPGTVLFDGELKSDGRLSGYAKLFRKGCNPIDYYVEGGFDQANGTLLLQGQAPIYSGQGCKITGYSDDNSASSLAFTSTLGSTGGSYARGDDNDGADGQPDDSRTARADPYQRDNDPYRSNDSDSRDYRDSDAYDERPYQPTYRDQDDYYDQRPSYAENPRRPRTRYGSDGTYGDRRYNYRRLYDSDYDDLYDYEEEAPPRRRPYQPDWRAY